MSQEADASSFRSSAATAMSTWQSKHSRRGLMYEAYKKFFGQPDPTNLVWQAGTKIMNPTIDADFLAEEFEARSGSCRGRI